MNELLKSIRNLCYSIFELTIAIVFLSIIFRQVEFNTLEKSVFFVGLVSMAIYFVIGLILKLGYVLNECWKWYNMINWLSMKTYVLVDTYFYSVFYVNISVS